MMHQTLRGGREKSETAVRISLFALTSLHSWVDLGQAITANETYFQEVRHHCAFDAADLCSATTGHVPL